MLLPVTLEIIDVGHSEETTSGDKIRLSGLFRVFIDNTASYGYGLLGIQPPRCHFFLHTSPIPSSSPSFTIIHVRYDCKYTSGLRTSTLRLTRKFWIYGVWSSSIEKECDYIAANVALTTPDEPPARLTNHATDQCPP